MCPGPYMGGWEHGVVLEDLPYAEGFDYVLRVRSTRHGWEWRFIRQDLYSVRSLDEHAGQMLAL